MAKVTVAHLVCIERIETIASYVFSQSSQFALWRYLNREGANCVGESLLGLHWLSGTSLTLPFLLCQVNFSESNRLGSHFDILVVFNVLQSGLE